LLFLFRLVGALPLGLLHRLGSTLGWLAARIDPVFRRRLDENLTGAGVAASPEALARLRRQAISEAGKTLTELPFFWFRPQAALLRRVTQVNGRQFIEQALGRGRGILFLTPHLGAFDLTAQWYGHHWPITVMYRQPKLAWLDPVVRAGRARGQVELVSADLRGVRAMLRALRAGRAVGLLPDQAPGAGEGVWSTFFGRPAYTMTLAARLAQSTGATVLTAVGRRLPDAAGYEIEFAPLAAPLPADPVLAARAINAAIEGLVQRDPGQYLWSYNRYKQPAGAPPAPLANAQPVPDAPAAPGPSEARG